MKRKMVNAEEQDTHTRARRFYLYLQRPGVTKKIKRRTNRRERREAKRIDWKNEHA